MTHTVERSYDDLELRIPMSDIIYLAANVKNSTLAVYIALQTYASFRDKSCFPSIDALSKRANVSKRTATAAIQELVSLQALTVTPRYVEGKKERASNRYIINRVPAQILRDVVQPLHEGGANNIPTVGTTVAQEVLPPEPTPINDVPSRKKTPLRASQIDPEFWPDDNLYEWCMNDGLTTDQIEAQVEQFVDHHTAKGSVMKDWSAAFRTWIRNARKWNSLGPSTSKANSPDVDPAVIEQMLGYPPRGDEQVLVHGPGHIEIIRTDGKKYRIKPEYHGVVWDSVTHYGSGGSREHREQVEDAKKRSEQ